VHVALVAHVPDELVAGAIKDTVKGDGKLDDAEVGSQVPAGGGYRGDDFMPELGSQFLQLRQR